MIALIAPFDAQGRLLLLKRDHARHCGDLWSLPGGKVKPHESPLAAAVRELDEEVGLAGEEWQWLGECDFDYPDRSLHFHLFRCRCDRAAFERAESPHAWVAPEALADYPMPEANSMFIRWLT